MAYNFQFSGDPVSIAAAAKAHAARSAADGQIGAATANATGAWRAAQEQADGMRRAKLYEQPANFASVLGQLYDSSGRNSSSMLGNYTNPYAQATNGYMAGLGGVAGALGNLGNAVGGMGVGAMQGLGATGQQLAANLGQIGTAQANSLAAQSNAAANAYGQLGMGNYNMQGQLGTAMAQAAAAEAAAKANAMMAQAAAGPQYAKLAMLGQVLPGVLASLNGGGANGGFNASGPQGPISSGTFSGTAPSWSGSAPSAGGSQFNVRDYMRMPQMDFSSGTRALGGFLNSQMDRMSQPGSDNNQILAGLSAQLSGNRDATMTSGREAIGAGQPLLSQVGGQMRDTYGQGLGAINGLADQIGGVGNQMGAGFNRFANDTGSAYRGAQNTLNGQFDKTFRGVNDLWDKSLGKNQEFLTPAEKAKQKFDEADVIRNRNDWLYATQNDPTSTQDRWEVANNAAMQAMNARRKAEYDAKYPPMSRREIAMQRRRYGNMA